jgi:hypothetical protein
MTEKEAERMADIQTDGKKDRQGQTIRQEGKKTV